MMDNYKIILINESGKQIDITNICGDLSRKDNIDTLGMELNVSIARNTEDKYMKNYDTVEVANKIVLMNKDKEVFRGIVSDLDTERFKKTITAFDYAFYLNKSKTVKQFRRVSVSSAINQLCKEFGVPVGNITNISTLITKIYNNETISDIIKDMLEQATKESGIKYRLEMRAGKLYIEKYSDLIVKGEFKLAQNIARENILNAIGSISKSESISEMRNSILISSGDEKHTKIVATSKDSVNIAKFGLLQEVESVDDKDIAQARNIANNKLKELNRIGEDISLSLLGDDKVRSGRILEINNEMFGLKGNYLVKDCIHNYQNGIHKMNVTVEKVI